MFYFTAIPSLCLKKNSSGTFKNIPGGRELGISYFSLRYYFFLKQTHGMYVFDQSLRPTIFYRQQNVESSCLSSNIGYDNPDINLALLVLFTNPSARAGYDTRSIF